MTAADRVVVVTGATRGIGTAIARRFAEPGATVVLGQRGDGGALAAELTAAGARAESAPLDVTSAESVEAFVARTLSAHGRIDVLVNNAGGVLRQSVLETSEADWDAVFDLNVKGVMRMSRAVGRSMVERRSGVIVNVSSIAGTFANTERAAYCASKAAVNLLTKVLALEWAPHGVRVNAVAPGFIETDSNGLELDDAGIRAEFEDRIPLGLGTPDHVAGAAYLLAAGDAAYMTGEIVALDGGWTIAQNFPRPVAAG
jgi:NAD(P)-dependent dehydrogenase (short-subunit alcohol dehydrogenase family)